MSRFLLPPECLADRPALTGDEARHLSQVLRIKRGETITVFDGRGRRATAEVLTVVARPRRAQTRRNAMPRPSRGPPSPWPRRSRKGKPWTSSSKKPSNSASPPSIR